MSNSEIGKSVYLVTMLIMAIGSTQALLAKDKTPLSKQASAEVIRTQLPTADKDSDGRVRRLFIAHNRLTDLNALQECPHLWYLESAYNNLENLNGIEHCTELVNVNLNRNQLTSLEGIEKLTKLEFLFLFGNDLTNISHLRNLKNLKLLVLTDNRRLTASQIASLRKSLPACDVVFDTPEEEREPTHSFSAPKSKTHDKNNLASHERLPKPSRHTNTGFLTERLTPFAAEVHRPSEWSLTHNHKGGNFTWLITKNKVDETSQEFETGVEIKAYFDVSKTTAKSPEAFATEYLSASIKHGKSETLPRQKKMQDL